MTISVDRVRVILDNKVCSFVTSMNIEFLPGKEIVAHLTIYKGKDIEEEKVKALLLNIESVEEKDYYRDDEGIVWTQFILKTITEDQ